MSVSFHTNSWVLCIVLLKMRVVDSDIFDKLDVLDLYAEEHTKQKIQKSQLSGSTIADICEILIQTENEENEFLETSS